MSKSFTYVVVFSILFAIGCTPDIEQIDEELLTLIESRSRNGELEYYIMPESDEYNKLPNQDPANRITKSKVALGQMLFFDPALAQNPNKQICYETYSCSSCHIPSSGFLPGRVQGIADGGVGFGNSGSERQIAHGYAEEEIDAQGNRPMTVMNVTYMTNTLWSGTFGATDKNKGTEDSWEGLAEVNHTGYMGLEAQNIEGFDLHRLEVNQRVLDDHGYRELFDLAFSNIPKSIRYTRENASFALGAFLRTILTNQAPFQDYLKGNEKALTDNQKEGAKLFFGEAGCVNCHNSPSFSNMEFFALGTADMYNFGGQNTDADDPRYLGRGMFTGREEDAYKFKVPQLYNLKDYATYFHGSSKTSIEDVIEFKLRAQSENPNVIDDEIALRPVSLTEKEKEQLIDFLTNALYDPDVERYMPHSVPSGYCFPNNDVYSKLDMGCQ
jgi:cytochrome c peroxidase